MPPSDAKRTSDARANPVPRFHHCPLPCRRTPVSSRTARSGSAFAATDVPTSTRSAPAAAMRSTSARVEIPLSAITGTPAGTSVTSRSAPPRSTANVARSRLFTPTAVGSTPSASSSSPAECTSTNTPSPWSRAARASTRRPSGASARTIRRMALAPAARASYSCSSSRMKSLRSTGTGTALATAPPCVYARACATGSKSSRIAPADGERRLTSAITPTSRPSRARPNGRGAGAARAWRSSSRARARRPATRSRVAVRIASSLVSGMLAFGRFSGRFAFGFRSGENVPLTRRQREILDFISSQISAQGYAPSFEEIAERFSFRSLATVHEHLTNLERKGYIRRAHNESRGIEVVPPRGQTGATDLPLHGLVAAGAPIEAVSGTDTIAVPDELIPRRGRSYVLKVRGQSMIDEHIKDGDFIVVHERNQADNGQTVVALVQGSSATVKRFYREPGGWIRLEPANPTMTALRVNERDVVVQGVVVGVIRKY